MKIYFNTLEVSNVFGVMPETVLQWRKEKKINGQNGGPRNGLVFRRSDILDFMRDNPKYGNDYYYARLIYYPEAQWMFTSHLLSCVVKEALTKRHRSIMKPIKRYW